MTHRAPFGILTLALTVSLLAAACGDDAAPATTTGGPTITAAGSTTAGSATTAAATTTTATTTTGAPTTTTVGAAATPPFPGDTSLKSGSGGIGLLTGVRVGDHEDHVRIVFDFQEPTFPNWEVAYVPGEIHGMLDPEGGWVEGEAFLVARFAPAGTADIREAVPVVTYAGSRRVDVDLGSVVQLLIVEDFEGQLWWAIGLAGERPFRVGTMTDPPRIYVDIAD